MIAPLSRADVIQKQFVYFAEKSNISWSRRGECCQMNTKEYI